MSQVAILAPNALGERTASVPEDSAPAPLPLQRSAHRCPHEGAEVGHSHVHSAGATAHTTRRVQVGKRTVQETRIRGWAVVPEYLIPAR